MLQAGAYHPQQILQHKARRARTGIHRGQDKQRLEQNGEVIPEGDIHQAAQRTVQNVGHAYRQRRRAARAGDNRLLSHFVSDLVKGIRRHGKAPVAHHLRRRRHHIGHARRSQHRHRAIHREIDARVDNTGRHQRHNRHEGLHQHAAVADKAGLAFIGQHLRRRAGGDQGMEAGNRAAGDGDKQEREQAAAPYRAGAIDKFGQRRHRQRRAHNQNTNRQTDNGADFQEGGEVVARRQQQPDRQHRGDKPVAHQNPGELYAGVVKPRRPGRAFRHPAAGNDGEHQHHQANHRHLANAPGAQIANIDPHENRQRDGKGYGVSPPRAVGQRFHHDHRQYREDNHHDHKAGHQRQYAGGRAHFLFHQFAERTSVAASGDEQHHKILYRPGQHHARENPDHSRQVAHLRRQHRADQRPRAGNGRKMVAEQHFFVGRNVVEAVVVTHRRGHARRVDRQYIFSDIQAVEAIGDQIDADCRDDNPQRVNLFTPV